MAEDVEKEGTVWCVGLAESGRRPLTEHEAGVLQGRRRQADRTVRFWRRGLRWSAVAAVLAYPVWVAWADFTVKQLVVSPILWCVILSAPAAVVGALVEVVVGYGRLLRTTFAMVFVGMGVGFALGTEGPLGIMLVGPCVLVVYLGGLFMLVLRWMEYRKLARLLPLLEADLDAKSVVEFCGVLRFARPPKALVQQGVRIAPNTEMSLAVLPSSGVLVAVGGRSVDSYAEFQACWDPLDVQETASGGGYEVPFPAAEGMPSADAALAQRHATESELQEMGTHARRLARRATGTFVGVSYFAAVGLRFIEAILDGAPKVTLSPLGWGFAVVIGAFSTRHALIARRKLKCSMQTRQVATVRPKDGDPAAPPAIEILMGTDLVWSVHGQPAPWRTVKW